MVSFNIRQVVLYFINW